MRPREAVTLVIVAVAVVGVLLLPRVEAALVGDADGCPRSGDVPKSQQLDSTRVAILCLLNEERTQHGLAPLRRSAALELASQLHSEDMATLKFFGTTRRTASTPV